MDKVHMNTSEQDEYLEEEGLDQYDLLKMVNKTYKIEVDVNALREDFVKEQQYFDQFAEMDPLMEDKEKLIDKLQEVGELCS